MTKFSGRHEGYKEVAQDIYILILNISHSNFIELEYRNITFDRVNHIFYECAPGFCFGPPSVSYLYK